MIAVESIAGESELLIQVLIAAAVGAVRADIAGV